MRKGDVEQGFADAEWVIEREYTNPSVQHVPMETHVAIVQWKVGDEVTIWTSAQSPFTVRSLFCAAMRLPMNQVRRRHPARRRWLRRQGRNPSRTARRLPVAGRRWPPGEAAGHSRGGVQPAAVPQRTHVSHQDGRALRRQDHRTADDDALGRRRLRRLRGQRHACLELLRRRSLRDSQRLARRVHHLHQQAIRHRLPRVRPTSSSSGASSATWSSSRSRSAWTRWSFAS